MHVISVNATPDRVVVAEPTQQPILRIKRLSDQAQPLRGAYDQPAGYDLTITHMIDIQDSVVRFGTGWACECPPGYKLKVVPRSSIGKLGWTVVNSPGIIDSDYRGELMVLLQPTSLVAAATLLEQWLRQPIDQARSNMLPPFSSDVLMKSSLHCLANELVSKLPLAPVQVMLERCEPTLVVEVEELSSTRRGQGGFGSSNAATQ